VWDAVRGASQKLRLPGPASRIVWDAVRGASQKMRRLVGRGDVSQKMRLPPPTSVV